MGSTEMSAHSNTVVGCSSSPADILAFPLARRRALIRRQAAWFVEQGGRAAELNLSTQLQRQRDVLVRKGIDPLVIATEILELEAAIRAEVARHGCAAGDAS